MVRGFATLLVTLALLASLAAGCGGGSDSVSLVWKSDGEEIRLDATRQDGPVFQTQVYVSNDTGSVLRDARLRFRPEAARDAPVGFRVGTVTPISSSFDGPDQLWRVGDLEPGARVAVPIGLWFNLDVLAQQSHPVELTLALVSPDLDRAIESNALRIRLASP
jgi:hypothetical protein